MTPPTLTIGRDVHPITPRVTGDDDLFIRMDRALGVPLANQVIWRLHTPISVERFTAIAERLTRTPVNRVVRRSRMVLARDSWVDAGSAGGVVVYDTETVSDDSLTDWLNSCVTTEFDLTTGPVWLFRAARLTGGGGIVSLISHHAVGDGWSGVRNVLRAVDPASDPLTLPAHAPSTRADARDAAGQISCITGNLGRLAVDAVRRRDRGSARPVITSQSIPRPPVPAPHGIAGEQPAHPPLAIASFDSAQWQQTAARHGGTSNALLVAITAGLIVAAGRATFDDAVRIVVPMSRQNPADDDLRANVTVGLHLDIPTDLSRDKNLSAIRALAKQMYQSSGQSPDPLARLQPLIQSLSDSALLRLNKDAATPLAVASNVGEFDGLFARLGTESVKDVALRSVPQHASPELLTRLRGGIACWLSSTDTTTTLSVGSYDPVHIPTQQALTKLVTDECARWDLSASLW
ncbi:hypothetical protein GOEFS_128_00180 [Gordonia effusa NBRC 100432]|uniref:Diacylglycerol O-acyltransferase n=1 Tax=Gordonia effusa NBRC 100432 TaxID=1077974 RepID=H0R6P9_9ACTN|nr:hypothetical protein [Gordonia effusa]GAB20750.1 hypothetical protein GOEFS_128_00180 [Gordonia effusa NBRC 100432]